MTVRIIDPHAKTAQLGERIDIDLGPEQRIINNLLPDEEKKINDILSLPSVHFFPYDDVMNDLREYEGIEEEIVIVKRLLLLISILSDTSLSYEERARHFSELMEPLSNHNISILLSSELHHMIETISILYKEEAKEWLKAN